MTLDQVRVIAERISKDLVGKEFRDLDSRDDGKLIVKVMTRAAEMRFELMAAVIPKKKVAAATTTYRDFSEPSRQPGEE